MSSKKGKKRSMEPMELEPLGGQKQNHDQQLEQQSQQPSLVNPIVFCQNLYLLVMAYASYYRGTTTVIASVVIIIGIILLLDFVVAASTKRHVATIAHDFTDARSPYELKMQKLDHWCLSGGDDDCRCDDPTLPMPNDLSRGWIKGHKYNKDLVADSDNILFGSVDVVFVGDDVTEAWNGRQLGVETSAYKAVNSYFLKTFSRNGGGEIDGLALGTTADSISNLLWRLQHGEMPNTLNPSVWWIEIGSNDLMKGQCAEEAVLLGILHLAEYISTQKPGAMIVINSILPQQAKVEPRNKHVGKFKPFEIMPSIQLINEQLDKFCKKHTQFKFFDATSLFFMSTPPKLADMKKNKKLRMPPLNPQLMDPTNKLTTEGYKQWGDAIAAEVKRIVYDEMYDEASELGFLDDMFTDDFSY